MEELKKFNLETKLKKPNTTKASSKELIRPPISHFL